MISISDRSIGQDFIQLPAGELIKTLDQYYHVVYQTWVIGSFFTSDKQVNWGRSAYRRPVTFGAKLSMMPALIGKIWNKKIKPLFSR